MFAHCSRPSQLKAGQIQAASGSKMLQGGSLSGVSLENHTQQRTTHLSAQMCLTCFLNQNERFPTIIGDFPRAKPLQPIELKIYTAHIRYNLDQGTCFYDLLYITANGSRDHFCTGKPDIIGKKGNGFQSRRFLKPIH